MTRKERAVSLYEKEGYNCSQAVAIAYCKVLGLSEQDAANMFSGFGGGFGGQHEVCGAISAMTAVMSVLVQAGNPDPEDKKRVYSRITNACKDFKKDHQSIICRDLIVSIKKTNPSPRPCGCYIAKVCDLIENSIGTHSQYSQN